MHRLAELVVDWLVWIVEEGQKSRKGESGGLGDVESTLANWMTAQALRIVPCPPLIISIFKRKENLKKKRKHYHLNLRQRTSF